jgi:hypothetical protein
MVAFILDRFCNPQETLNNKYTDPQYKYNSKNYHHIIDGINPEIGRQIVQNPNNRKYLRPICDKITNYEKLDISVVHDNIFFSSRESLIIQEILATIPLEKIKHMETHRTINNTPIPEFEKTMQQLVLLRTPR